MSKDMSMTSGLIDLLHLYKTETVDLGVFVVTVREIPHGDYVDMQKDMMGTIRMSSNKRDMERQISSITLSAPEFSDRKNLLGIASWTLQNRKKEDVPVSIEAWHALPHSITSQIEAAIERLNPEMDEDFQDESGNGSQS